MHNEIIIQIHVRWNCITVLVEKISPTLKNGSFQRGSCDGPY